MKSTKYLIALLCCVVTLSPASSVKASATVELSDQSIHQEFTNQADLNRKAEEYNIDLEGLEKIIIDECFIPDVEDEQKIPTRDTGSSGLEHGSSSKTWDTYTLQIRNVKCTRTFYNSNDYYEDKYDGPLKTTVTYSRTGTSVVKSDFGLSGKVLKAGLGFETGQSSTFTKTIEISIDSKKQDTIRTYINYAEYSYDVYKVWDSSGRADYLGTEYAYKPVGIVVTQSIHKK